MSFYRQQLENYLKTLDIKADSVLDIGGSANPICNRVRSWDVKDYKILDNNNEKGLHGDKWREPDYIGSIEQGRYKTNISLEYTNLDSDDLQGQFDVIFILEVLEYCNDFESIIYNIERWFNVNGFLYITINSFYPNHNPIDSDSSRLTDTGFEKLIKGKFEILEKMPRYYSPEAFKHIQEAWRIDGLRASKGYPYHDVVGWIYKLKNI